MANDIRKVDDAETPITISIKVNTDKLWIGDPCYALSDEYYDKIVNNKKWSDCVLGEEDGEDIGLLRGTWYGDGSYNSETGWWYHVDAGVLSVIDFNKCDMDNPCLDDGQVITLEPAGEHEITLVNKNGTFGFYVDGIKIESIYTYKRTKMPKRLRTRKAEVLVLHGYSRHSYYTYNANYFSCLTIIN